MKIAILTYPLHSNFGCIMQAYALQSYIRNIGHEVYTIYITPEKTPFYNKIKQTIKDIIHTIKGVPGYRAFRYWPSNKQQAILDKNTWDFISENIQLTSRINSFKDLKNFDTDLYDAYIVGSDQVWRYAYLSPISIFYFDFLPDDKLRMSYAASFGISKLDYPPKIKEKCKELLSKFHTITVREYEGIEICKSEFNSNAYKVLDPVFLLDKQIYVNLANNAKRLSNKKYLFTYILDRNKEKSRIINKLANEMNLEIINLLPPSYSYYGPKHIDKLVYPSVYELLRAFCDADYIVTDSFHGTAFSIIFNKRFTVFLNNNRGNSRLYSILQTFNLEQCIYSNEYEVPDINYEGINNIILQLREKSTEYIKRFLLTSKN